MEEKNTLILSLLIIIIIVLVYNKSCREGMTGYFTPISLNGQSPLKNYTRNSYLKKKNSGVENMRNGDEDIYEKDDYKEYILNNSLEPSVIDSHNKFTSEMINRTSGASVQTVFSHDSSPNPWIGLRRAYADVAVSGNSREVPSETNDQLKEDSNTLRHCLY